MERRLIGQFEAMLDKLAGGLTKDNLPLATRIATVPQAIRGYGHIKAKSIVAARKKRDELLSQLARPQQKVAA